MIKFTLQYTSKHTRHYITTTRQRSINQCKATTKTGNWVPISIPEQVPGF